MFEPSVFQFVSSFMRVENVMISIINESDFMEDKMLSDLNIRFSYDETTKKLSIIVAMIYVEKPDFVETKIQKEFDFYKIYNNLDDMEYLKEIIIF